MQIVMSKGSVYIDSDSFFWPSDISDEYMREQREGISFEKESQPFEVLFEQYYLGFRSSLIVCEENLKSKFDGLEILEDWRKSCILMARDYTIKHLSSDISLPVDFMWITKMKIINEIKDEYPDAEKILLKINMKPTISARIKNKNIIVFPALLRTLLNHCNLVLVNASLETIDTKSTSIDRRLLSRFILPYLLFCHDDFSVRNLPIIGGYSKEAITTALSYTNLQVMYVFAHEYAHILLKHFDKKISSLKSQEMMENEADEFALDVILKYIERDETYTKDDVFTAIRWLFKYQLLEESIGALIRKNDLNYFLSNYEERRSCFQLELIKKCNITKTTMLDVVGFCSIVELQDVLCENGTNLIDTIIQAFNKSKHKGVVEPWWEMITQKQSQLKFLWK